MMVDAPRPIGQASVTKEHFRVPARVAPRLDAPFSTTQAAVDECGRVRARRCGCVAGAHSVGFQEPDGVALEIGKIG